MQFTIQNTNTKSPLVYVRCCPLLLICVHYIPLACFGKVGLSLTQNLSLLIGYSTQSPSSCYGTSVTWHLIDKDSQIDLQTQCSAVRKRRDGGEQDDRDLS